MSLLDILILMVTMDECPAFVARESTKDAPIVGWFSKIYNCIYVPSKVRTKEKMSSPKSSITSQIINYGKRYTKNKNSMGQLAIFSEGTTTNGHHLINFRRGAFVAGCPIQPVIIEYPYTYFNPSWEVIPFWSYLFRSWCQFTIPVSVTVLPTINPTQEEKNDPLLYSQQTRKYMAKFMQRQKKWSQ